MLAIYCRVSTKEQEDQYSIPIQRDKGIQFAKQINEDYRVYIDSESGKNFKREGFIQLQEDIKNYKINKIWVVDEDRFSRDTATALAQLHALHKKDIKLYIDGREIEEDNPNHYFIFTMKTLFGDYERKKKLKRSKEGLLAWKDSGKWTYNRLFGYDCVYDSKTGKKKWVINENEAKVIRLVFKMFIEGKSFNKMSVILNDELIPTRFSKKWDANRVLRIIKQRMYTGKYKNTKGALIKSEIYDPIITLDLYKRAHRYWNEDKKKRQPDTYHSKYRINHQSSSIIRCKSCNGPFHFAPQKDKRRSGKFACYNYYKGKHSKSCQRSSRRDSFKAEHIDLIFTVLYLESLINQKDLNKFFIEKNRSIKVLKKQGLIDKKQLENQLKKVNNEKLNLIHLSKSVRADDDIIQQIDELRIKAERINKKIDEIEKAFIEEEEEYIHLKEDFQINKCLAYLYGSPAERRTILQSVIDKAYVDKKIFTINMKTGRKYQFKFPRLYKNSEITFKIQTAYKNEEFKDFIEIESVSDRYYPVNVIYKKTKFNEKVSLIPYHIKEANIIRKWIEEVMYNIDHDIETLPLSPYDL